MLLRVATLLLAQLLDRFLAEAPKVGIFERIMLARVLLINSSPLPLSTFRSVLS